MKTNSNFIQAQADYEFAANELMRPEEDVVLLSACHSVKKAIRGYLSGFLESEKISYSDSEDIESLMQKCIKKDIDFLRFDMDQLNCKCDSGECTGKSYCLSFEQVNRCIALVSELDNFLLSKK